MRNMPVIDPLNAYGKTISLKQAYLIIALAGTVMLLLILHNYYNGKHLYALSSPLLTAIREVRLEAAAVQKESKEMLRGNQAGPHANVWLYLDQSIWHLQNMFNQYDGLGKKENPAASRRIDRRIEEIRNQLAVIKSFYKQNAASHLQHELETVLADYERHFTVLKSLFEGAESRILELISRERMIYHVSHAVMILFCVIVTGIVAFAVRRYERYRTAGYEALTRVQEDLRTANYQLEDRVSERTLELSLANLELKAEVEERRLAERRLRESRNTLQTLIDGIKDALILVDRDLRIRMLNRQAFEICGIGSSDMIIGKHCRNAFRKSDEIDHEFRIQQLIKQGQMCTFERRVPGNPDRLEQVSIYPVAEKEGQAGGAILRIADITETRRFEQQLIKNEKMASLGILVASIVHEINNPNNFVTFNIPILKEYIEELVLITDQYAKRHPEREFFHMSYSEFRQDILKLVGNIEHGAGRISSFVANLRGFSQNNGSRRKVLIDLHSVVDKVLTICNSQIKKSIKTFKLDISPDQPLIYADRYSLEQVLLNLIVNAVQAADKSDSFVNLSASTGVGWHDRTIITVSDNGCGMDEKTKNKIFDPFFSTKNSDEGTGLGLYVSHNLVQNMGGRIEVQSRVGIGSSFSVLLSDKERRIRPRPQPIGRVDSLQQVQRYLNQPETTLIRRVG